MIRVLHVSVLRIIPEFPTCRLWCAETWIFAILCSFIHASINSKCTTRWASRIEARRRCAREKCTTGGKKKEGRMVEGEEEGGGRKERNSPGSSLLPRRATISLRASNFNDEATRAGRSNTQGDEVLSTCNAARYSYSSPGKWFVKALRAVDTQGHPWPCGRLEAIGEAVNRNSLWRSWAKF